MSIVFYILAALLVLSALGVVLMRNPIHSALFLIANLLLVAGVYAALAAHFLAVVQVIVYAGAIMVLVVFVIMLLNIKQEKPGVSGWTLGIVSVAIGTAFLYGFAHVIQAQFGNKTLVITENVGTVANIGKLLYSDYVFPFEAASVLIMAGIVGATMLAKRNYKKKEGASA